MNSFTDTILSILKRQAYWRPIEYLWLIELVTHITNLRWFLKAQKWIADHEKFTDRRSKHALYDWIYSRTNVVSHIPNYRPPHHACHSRLSSSTFQRNFVIDDTDWMGIIFHRYSTHSYSYAPYKSFRMQTINIAKRASSQSTHKVPKRRRLAPSWDVADDRTPHQLVHGDMHGHEPKGRFKNSYELLNLRALKFSPVNKIHIFQCMGKIFCVEFQRYPLKFHTKYLTQTLKDMIFIQHWNFKSS